MPAVVAMLRGVNVGGHGKVNMGELKALCESLGFGNVQTYVQSGNVVFTTPKKNLASIGRAIEEAMEKAFSFRPAVITRNSAELRQVFDQNPFATRPEIEPNKLLVTFLADHPSNEVREKVMQIKTDPEELNLKGRELYIYFPNGAGRSKLPVTAIEKVLKTPGTSRNWNSVTKLLAMAEKLDAR